MRSCQWSSRPPSSISVAELKHIFNELHYEMTRKIAEGGMGLVYEAVQLGAGNFRKVVAIKIIRTRYRSPFNRK